MDEIHTFLNTISSKLFNDNRILALCIGGSWIQNQVDNFSDLDLVLITCVNISNNVQEMLNIASGLGELVAGFTGEHVGEKRLLICLYSNPIIHVDFKFLQVDEFKERVENPVILWERDNVVTDIYKDSTSDWPKLDFQWIEDRFWVWIHYIATKLGRGELIESISFLTFLRTNVIGPLFHIKYGNNHRCTRKLEFILDSKDLEKVIKTIPVYSFNSIKDSILCTIELYRELRKSLFGPEVALLEKAEVVSVLYLDRINSSES